MADIVLKGNTSGSITITSPDVSGVNVLTLPVETGTILTTNTPLPEVSSVEFAGAGTSSGNITITAPDTDETNTLTFPETTGTFAVEKSLGMRNLIINGNMQIAQRATSVTGITSAGYDTCDRWKTDVIDAGTWTQTQDTDAPSAQGFATSLKMNCTTTDSPLDGNNRVFVGQRIEAFNVQSLAKGTANAKSTTLSFWVKSNKIGTYIVELFDNNNGRQISAAYTISVADTWEKKTITFAGDTSGTLPDNNGIGLMVQFWLAAGSDYTSGTLNTSWAAYTNTNRAVGQVNLADSTDNYINITGVQLEANTTATPFENLMYSQQLALCQRYYYKWDTTTSNNWVAWAMAANTTNMYGHVPFPTTMRSNPSSIQYSGMGWWVGGAVTSFSAVSIAESGTDSCTMNFASTGLTAQKMYAVLPNGNTNYIAFNSEL